jgi:hypothetical protein
VSPKLLLFPRAGTCHVLLSSVCFVSLSSSINPCLPSLPPSHPPSPLLLLLLLLLL